MLFMAQPYWQVQSNSTVLFRPRFLRVAAIICDNSRLALMPFVQAGLDTENKGSEVKGTFQRIDYAFSGVAYGGLALSAFKMVLSLRGNKNSSQQD
jgi:hypothetical protein